MDRQVKGDDPHIPVPFTNTGNKIYHRGSAANRGGLAVGPRWTDERDCRVAQKHSLQR